MHQLRRPSYDFLVKSQLDTSFGTTIRPVKTSKSSKNRYHKQSNPYLLYENLVKDMRIIYPDQVRITEITYIQLKQDLVFLAIIMDVYIRAIRGWSLSQTLDQQS
ncbi:hypothetical protein JW887_02700 [Candidatus Dojkabacteria bacterium]|nr:hypothetical protein [Candidatus Dojkabacteria bacterium]